MWTKKLEELKKEHEEKRLAGQSSTGLIGIPLDFDSNLTFGHISFDPCNDQEGLLVFYSSRLYKGFQYEFEINPSNFLNYDNQHYQVLACHKCKKAKKEGKSGIS